MLETRVRSLGQEDPLEKEMATRSSILAWEIPWTEEPGAWGHKELDTTKRRQHRDTRVEKLCHLMNLHKRNITHVTNFQVKNQGTASIPRTFSCALTAQTLQRLNIILISNPTDEIRVFLSLV